MDRDSSSSVSARVWSSSQGRLRCSLAPISSVDDMGSIPAAPRQLCYGLWEIVKYDTPSLKLHASDGRPVLHKLRGGNGTSSRFIVQGRVTGFLDITDLGVIFGIHLRDKGWQYVDNIEELAQCSAEGEVEEGASKDIIHRKRLIKIVNALDINGHRFTYPIFTNAQLVLAVDKVHPNCLTVMSLPVTAKNTIDCPFQYTLAVSAPLVPLPEIIPGDIELLKEMMDLKLVPYQNIPDAPGKSVEELQKLGKQFFGPLTASSFELAMSLYDWTTACFFRLVLFKHFVYTAILPDTPLDMDTIALMIWQSNWKSYNPGDVDFMGSLLMKPASSLDDVQAQLLIVSGFLRVFVDAECRLISAGLLALPRMSIKAIPKLYSGQVDVYDYTTSRFLPLFLEFPGNAGPTSSPLQQPLKEGEESQLKVGNILTCKACVSLTTTKEDALHYANGILLILSPPSSVFYQGEYTTWPKGGYVTPLSDNPHKIEYVMPPLTRFTITDTNFEDEQLVVISLMLLVD